MLKYLFPVLVLYHLSACTPRPEEKADSGAVALNDSASQLAESYDSLQIEQALELWTDALALQSDYFPALWNKMVFENHQGRRTEALAVAGQLEKLRPEDADIRVAVGVLLELGGDSLTAREKFVEADKLYKKQLNDLAPSTGAFQLKLINYAVNLKFLGLEADANRLLEDIKNRHGNEDLYDMAEGIQIKSRQELLNRFNPVGRHP